MIVYEFKLKGKDSQYRAIDEAIRTSQFIQNKCLRYWMDNKDSKVDKYALNKYCAVLAAEFPFADELNSMARQSAAERSWSAIARFYDNCKKKVKGKKGFPQFKKTCRSVEYKTSGWKLSETRKAITFSDKKGIGTLKLKGTYDLNYYNIEQIKRVRLLRRADGYYAQFSIDVNIRVERQPTHQVVGLDLGLNYFIADSKGNVEPSPKFYRKSEKQLNRANRKKSKKFSRERKKAKQRQSNNYHKARNRYARKHLRVSRQRKEYCKRLAYSVIQSHDLVAYEDLNVKGMVKNRCLAKSISDAGWATFRRWLEYFGHKYGKVTVAVPPHNTSQNCSNCGQKVKKSLSTRTHVCNHCGFVEDRDINASINILKLGLSTAGHAGTYATGDLPSWAIGVNLSSNGESVNVESPRL
ncbi:transposase [Desertifilum sp. FACHB-1129]|uniref:Transposase n=2 Tax=Desertifilum tharense IPPAS B-1220 TaxID=1781255 RepID=A0A1E5QL58_9CYAN|nr:MULTISPECIES: RNA-guided endonuclease TnpB family protein [Desertifilum]MDA0209978.1 transposase [Cyanobacteria bacterium FC1]MBD2313755.1 transposase [Desertifilum sp. FACHB-1129]MBD2324535.1 transposase [Desertifilum sp. FACHB-866]MBD2334549.1 transposase [Desertifilum sp. FACHB-868]OEJ75422.1 transposase [Desertifilum tharense IPPAS B-1220]